MFNQDSKGYKGAVERPAGLLFEKINHDALPSPPSGPLSWATVENAQRIPVQCPIVKLESVVRGLRGQLGSTHAGFAEASATGPGSLSLSNLHGEDYRCSAASTEQSVPVIFTPTSNHPVYAVQADFAVLSGGTPYHGILAGSHRQELPLAAQIVLSALQALPRCRAFHTLSYEHSALTDADMHAQALEAMVPVCRWNHHLSAIAFPPLSNRVDKATDLGRGSSGVAAVWAKIGYALWSNPRPLFHSLDFRQSRLHDTGLDMVLPALGRLFGSRGRLPGRGAGSGERAEGGRGLLPLRLCLDSCGITASGVEALCKLLLTERPNHAVEATAEAKDGKGVAEAEAEAEVSASLITPTGSTVASSLQELSLGGNDWCSASGRGAEVRLMRSVLQSCSLLSVLNLESTARVFPVNDLLEGLEGNQCPLTIVRLGGCKVPREQVGVQQPSAFYHRFLSFISCNHQSTIHFPYYLFV